MNKHQTAPRPKQNPNPALKAGLWFIAGIVTTIIVLVLSNKYFNAEPVVQYDLPLPVAATDNTTGSTANQENPANSENSANPVKQQTASTAHWRHVTVKHGDNFYALASRLGISTKDRLALEHNKEIKHALVALRPGEYLHAKFNAQQQLLQLDLKYNAEKSLQITRHDDSYFGHLAVRKPEVRVHYAMGTIKHSLLATAAAKHVPEDIIFKLADIFAWDIDFAKDIRPGDKFVVIYEDFYLDDHKLGDGPILAAEFINQGKTYKAIRYTVPHRHPAYYTPAGHSLRKALLRAPVKYTRISSKFSLHRMHPLLHYIRPHKGVDYAAPEGTPIHATGDGTIVLIGRDGGYGNTVKIKNHQDYLTIFGHMSRFAKGLHRHSHVRQGQIIGYVGHTGLATGPHVHYEVHHHGKAVNPLKIRLPHAAPIDKKHHKQFMARSRQLLAQLKLYANAMTAGAAKAATPS